MGQSESFVVAKLVAAFRRREPVIALGNTEIRRDLSDVRFVSAVYTALLESNRSGVYVNICRGASICIGEALDILKRLTGHAPEIRSQGSLMRPDEIYELVGDNTRLQQIVGAIPHPSWEESFRWMLEGDRI